MEFGDGLKKIFLAGVGAMATTAETTKDVIDKLVEKGEITVDQGKVFNEELKRTAKEKVKEHVDIQVTKNFDDAFASVNEMSAEERRKLKERIEELEKEEIHESEG